MTDYTRKNHIITEVATGQQTVHKSINQAKKASRKLQQSGSTMRVIK